MRKEDERFESLYRREYPRVVAYFVLQGCPREEARDLAQDVFARVYTRMGTFRGDSTEATWLLSIARSMWLNKLRFWNARIRRGVTRSLDAPLTREGEGTVGDRIVSPEPGPQTRAEDNERRRRLDEALQRLPARCRGVLLMQNQGLKYREIASVLGISIETVKSLRHDGVQRLKRIVSGLEASPAEYPQGSED